MAPLCCLIAVLAAQQAGGARQERQLPEHVAAGDRARPAPDWLAFVEVYHRHRHSSSSKPRVVRAQARLALRGAGLAQDVKSAFVDYLLPLLAFCLRLSLRAALPVFLPPMPCRGILGAPGSAVAVSPPYWRNICAQLPLPVLIWRIMVRISLNCSRSLFTSWTVVPLPREIRLLRLP